MENLEEIGQDSTEYVPVNASEIYREREDQYRTFAEQFLEAPAHNGKYQKLAHTVTICTWRMIPTIDDW